MNEKFSRRALRGRRQRILVKIYSICYTFLLVPTLSRGNEWNYIRLNCRSNSSRVKTNAVGRPWGQ